MPGRTRIRPGIIGTALLGVAVILLSACHVDTRLVVVVDRHGSGTITLTAIADADIVTAAPTLQSDLRLDDAKTAGWLVIGPSPVDGGGLQIVLSHAFASLDEANQLLSQLAGTDGPLQFPGGAFNVKNTYGRTSITFNGRMLLNNSTAGFGDAALTLALGAPPYRDALAERGLTIGKAFGLQVDLTLPGTKDPYQWAADFDGPAATAPGVTMTASTVYGKDTRAAELLHGALPWVAAAWAVLFFVVVVPAVMLYRRRKRIDTQQEL
jgi:hypothetical protein